MLKIAKQRTIYWEIRWRFSEDGHNNAGEVSDEFSILESSQNVFPMSGKLIRAKTMSDRDKVIESDTVVTETSGVAFLFLYFKHHQSFIMLMNV